MSFRRFMVLVRHLSGQSATVAHLNSDRFIGRDGRTERVVTIEGAAAVERSLAALYKKGSPARVS